jgi:RP/EB family microtubule-associated protein
MTESFGMMDGTYFVNKNEILKWLNSTYQLNMNKIEQACTGAVYCQIIDSLHPGKVKMHKVNWKARLEHEFLNNYKILQQAFTDCKIAKYIEVSKLAKGKYQDNLEFLQWMKRYFDERRITTDYDPVLRRNGCDLEIISDNANALAAKKRDNSKNQVPFPSGNFKSNKTEKNLMNNIAPVKKDVTNVNNFKPSSKENCKFYY